MEPLTESLDDAQFAMHVSAILHGERPDEALNEPGYKHRQGDTHRRHSNVAHIGHIQR